MNVLNESECRYGNGSNSKVCRPASQCELRVRAAQLDLLFAQTLLLIWNRSRELKAEQSSLISFLIPFTKNVDLHDCIVGVPYLSNAQIVNMFNTLPRLKIHISPFRSVSLLRPNADMKTNFRRDALKEQFGKDQTRSDAWPWNVLCSEHNILAKKRKLRCKIKLESLLACAVRFRCATQPEMKMFHDY